MSLQGETMGERFADRHLFGRIAQYLESRLFPCGDRFSQRVLLSLYRLVAKGSPVTLEGLGAAIGAGGAGGDGVREAVAAVPPSRLQYDEAGRIIAFAGLSQVPANHRFMFAERALFTWCAFDGLFLPALLGGRARISSICPVTHGEIRVTLGRNPLEAIEPEPAVMSFVMPDQERRCTDLRGSFCNHVNFFASRRAGEVWLEHNAKAVMLSLDDAFALGRVSNQANFRHALADESIAQPSRGGTT